MCELAGLERGLAGEPAEFTIVTKDAGPGGLALAVHGPSKAEIKCQDNGDGTCSVQYVPEEPGTIHSYLLHKYHPVLQPSPDCKEGVTRVNMEKMQLLLSPDHILA